MNAEAKMRTLASQDSGLQSYFLGTNGTFRWFDSQLQPGYIAQGPCATVQRVATGRLLAHGTSRASHSVDQQQPRMQIKVLSYDQAQADAAAAEVIDWLTTRADFSTDDQFGSPTLVPTRHPNFILNELRGMEAQPQGPAYVRIIDARIFDLQEQHQ